jgi:hypothetical protein
MKIRRKWNRGKDKSLAKATKQFRKPCSVRLTRQGKKELRRIFRYSGEATVPF